MPTASSNLAQVRYAPEAVYGTIPSTSTVGARALRITGESLTYAVQSDTSKELRSDRQVTDLVLTGASASGGVNFQASYAEFDELLEATLMGTWSPLGASASTFTGTSASATAITATVAPTGNDAFTNLFTGQWIRVVAPGNLCNGQIVKIHASTSPTSTVITLDPSTPLNGGGATGAGCAIDTLGCQRVSWSGTWLANGTSITIGVAPTGTDLHTTNLVVGQWVRLKAPGNGADGTLFKVAALPDSTHITLDAATPLPNVAGTGVTGCRLVSTRLSNSTTQRSFTVEKGFTDAAQYFAYRGMNLSKLSMSFASGAIVGGSFEFLGKDCMAPTGATQLSSTAQPSKTGDVMNAVAGVGNVLENGSAITGTYIKSLKFDLDNKLRGQTAIGVFGNAAVVPGTLEVKGEIEVYLANGTMYSKFINNTATSIEFTMKDMTTGFAYALKFPKVKFNDAKVQAGGLDQDVMLTMPFTALMDTTTNKTFIIDRI